MEVVCDDYLYIWHLMFGIPGSKNDNNIMNASPLFSNIRAGKWPPYRPQIDMAGFPLSWFNYLADGIYPRFRIFAQTCSQPRTLREKLYSKHHEGARKSVERVFGVLFKRFGILYKPSRLLYKEDMRDVVRTCCILRNMIVRARRDRYTGTRSVRLPEDEGRLPADIRPIDMPRTRRQQIDRWRELCDNIESAEQYLCQQAALMDHIWQERGAEASGIQESDRNSFVGNQ
jgi:hypothetical protein